MILKCERKHKHGSKLQRAIGSGSGITAEGPNLFHFRGWDRQSNNVVIVNNMQEGVGERGVLVRTLTPDRQKPCSCRCDVENKGGGNTTSSGPAGREGRHEKWAEPDRRRAVPLRCVGGGCERTPCLIKCFDHHLQSLGTAGTHGGSQKLGTPGPPPPAKQPRSESSLEHKITSISHTDTHISLFLIAARRRTDICPF